MTAKKKDTKPANTASQDWKDRLIVEADELRVKHTALKKFLTSDKVLKMPDSELNILKNQFTHMNGYLLTLERRISRLK